MIDFKSYLKDGMGLPVRDRRWPEAAELPLFLAKAATYHLCSCNGVRFIAAEIEQRASLPDLKRISSQVSLRAGLSVAIVAQIDARQRKALVSQGIPFVVPGRQAFLPMLGFVVSTSREPAPLLNALAPGTQAILVTLMENPKLRTSEGLMGITGMPPSSVSRALDELARRGLVSKSKEGREVVISRSEDRNELVKSALAYLRNPIARVTYARKDERTALLPLAGESALSERSMLATPKLEQRAMPKKTLSSSAFDEVQLGELRNEETVQIQLWTYNPLVAGGGVVDDVSLALSLIGEEDERVIGQLNALFKEELWQ